MSTVTSSGRMRGNRHSGATPLCDSSSVSAPLAGSIGDVAYIAQVVAFAVDDLQAKSGGREETA